MADKGTNMNDKQEIGACPFCGSVDVRLSPMPLWFQSGYLHQVECESCMARGSQTREKAEAVALWNGAGRELRKKIAELEAQLQSAWDAY